ncbi:selenide, water dikinase SelD [Paragemmobacter straminiformis]|uniref:Selenide, water dikinase SelD n=1 Tax=Paragemmobacter straminiformis TaxID=2045119 RepID=A0A842I5D7_9RHOB|nr:selenide, water dikinase SelD [Gemmobacter straminiformis]MBC2834623.1 selenide, water dikinase SelD [Gemmobacter straminiformis]
MIEPLPLVQDVVLIGGGHTHALVLRMFAMDPLPGVRLTVINPDPAAPYTGMLPGHIAGHYTKAEMMIDLVRLARFAGARVILDRATGIDRAGKRVLLAGRAPLAYDLCSIDIGIASDLPDVPGYALHATSAKPLGTYAERWEAFVERRLPAPRLVIIGAGVGGVELALASAHRLRAAGAVPQITLLSRGPALPHIGAAARSTLLAQLAAQGIALIEGASPATITAGAVTLSDGRTLPSDFTLTVAGARPQGWLAATGLDLHEGFVTVSPALQSSDPAIFAAGDCAHLGFAPRPKAGVYAVRAAPVLNHNLRAVLTGQPLQAFRPQRDYLKLVSLGGKRALADKFGLGGGAGWLWRLKDRIDAKFMAKFADYPAMPRPLPAHPVAGLAEALGEKPLCGGCGAKVGAMALSEALSHLPAPARADVLAGAGDDAAILTHGAGKQVITTDHLRATCGDPRLMARITAIHALGDIWAMGAAPQAALAQVTLPRMGARMQAETLAEIMEEAAAILRAAGADIVGGHTTIGAELTIGFTLTGLAETPITKAGARPGDALILTKAIGTGTILAADMALARIDGLILGQAVQAAYASMSRPQAGAAAILAPHAHAMTDITGFGLAGHLLEMLDASQVAARIELAAIPLLHGASALAAAGQASSLAPANRAATDWRMTAPHGPVTTLLADPQTAGPLLAAVPADTAQSLLQALRDAGETAAIIGHVTAGAPHITAL